MVRVGGGARREGGGRVGRDCGRGGSFLHRLSIVTFCVLFLFVRSVISSLLLASLNHIGSFSARRI